MKKAIKGFVVGAFPILYLALFAAVSAVEAQTGSWRLVDYRVFNNMDASVAAITSERYDASGGSVDINLSGNIFSTCPGGIEKVRFNWNFPDDITEVINGGGVSVSLEGGQAAKSQNCGTQLASRSFIYIYPGTFALEGANSLDRERFLSGNNFRAYAAEGVKSGAGTIKVNTHSFEPNRPKAYFEVCVQTPTRSGGGYLCYAYIYENSSTAGSSKINRGGSSNSSSSGNDQGTKNTSENNNRGSENNNRNADNIGTIVGGIINSVISGGGSRTNVPPTIAWGDTAGGLRGRNGERFDFSCPALREGRGTFPVWGSEIYTDNSSICTAAVHAGLVTKDSGGRVTVEIRAGQSHYDSNTRNGVTSICYGSFGGSFSFVR